MTLDTVDGFMLLTLTRPPVPAISLKADEDLYTDDVGRPGSST